MPELIITPKIKKGKHIALRKVLDPWPHGRTLRTLTQLVLSLPFLAITLWYQIQVTGAKTTSPNIVLLDRINDLNITDTNLDWLNQFYPPLPSLFAVIFNSELALGIVGSFIAGWFAHAVWEVMVQRRFPYYLQIIIMFAVIFNPITFYNATQNLGGFLATAVLGIGTIQMVRFIEFGSTYHGFQASLMFAAATLSSSYGIIFVLIIVISSSLLKWHRIGFTGAIRSTLTVILLPSIGIFVTFLIISWMLTGSAMGRVEELLSGFTLSTILQITTVYNTPLFLSFAAPSLGVWAVAQLSHRKGALAFAFALVLVQLAVMFLVLHGITSGTGVTYLMLVILSLALIPQNRTVPVNILISVIMVMQIVISYWIIITRYNSLGKWFETLITYFN